MGCEKESEYVTIARQRIADLNAGKLPYRPLGKPIHVPSAAIKWHKFQLNGELKKPYDKSLHEYSFNNGKEEVARRFPDLLPEVSAAIKAIDAEQHRIKESKEKTKMGQLLYSPVFYQQRVQSGICRIWLEICRVTCDYETAYYEPGYSPKGLNKGAFREMDFVKNKLGIEVQFGKYSFMVYNVAAEMTIFRNLGHIECGIEIVPVKAFSSQMSSGVSYFEQFVWDLKNRGVADIDIPVLILGIDA